MAKVKVARKQWFPLMPPKIFGSSPIGETHIYESEQAAGKTVTKNLMELTNDIKKQNINVKFKVFSVMNDKAYTNIVGYYMVPSSIRRLVRRNINKMDMSFTCKTSDKTLQIKPLLITKIATKGSIVARIRKTAQDFLVKYAASMSYDNFINDLITHKVQTSLRATLNKIYPLRVCEIRSMELLDLDKRGETESKEKQAKTTEPKSEKKAEKGKDKGKEEEEEEEVQESDEGKDTEEVEEQEEEPSEEA
jgi:small subunit ribosomal protein S3Ae